MEPERVQVAGAGKLQLRDRISEKCDVAERYGEVHESLKALAAEPHVGTG